MEQVVIKIPFEHILNINNNLHSIYNMTKDEYLNSMQDETFYQNVWFKLMTAVAAPYVNWLIENNIKNFQYSKDELYRNLIKDCNDITFKFENADDAVRFKLTFG